MYKTILIFLILVSSYLHSQILPEERRINWEHCGLSSSIDRGNVYYFNKNGGSSDGITPNDEALENLLNNTEKPTTILFGEGIYLFNSPIILSSGITLLGFDHEATTLLFRLENEQSLITASGKKNGIELTLDIDFSKNQNTFEIPEAFEVQIGDYFYLFDDDIALITSDWAKNTTGQLLEVIAITNGFLKFSPGLRRDYHNPKIIKYQPVKDIKISSLKIIADNPTERQTSNIRLTYAVNCEICCNESVNCNFAHFDMRYSRNIFIHDNYIHHAHSYGGGGKAYGVVLHSATSDCLIEDNIFEHLRHSVLIQSGGNGNVIGYNYSLDPYWTDVTLPENSAGDLVLHGNYPYLNLFEGNIAQNIVIDDSHGKNGPYNTFFRNRAELFGIFMNFSPPSDNQNFIGNEITNTGFLKGLYMLSGSGHFEFGNNVKGGIKPTGTNDLDDLSYYLKEIPEQYNEMMPLIGPPNNLNEKNNSAYKRYYSGDFIQCDNSVGIIEHDEHKKISKITCSKTEFLKLISQNNLRQVSIYDINGRSFQIDQPNILPNKVYIIELKKIGTIAEKIIVIID